MTTLLATNPVSYLREEYDRDRDLFEAQPALLQRFIEAQARQLADAILEDAKQARFSLPDRVVGMTPHSGEMATMLVPAELRDHGVGGWGIQKRDLQDEVRQRLSSLERSPDQAVHTGAVLLRYAIAAQMIHQRLPAGRAVTYRAEDDEEIPTVPVDDGHTRASAITAGTDAIAEQDGAPDGRGELQVPFAPAALRFYIPQWVAFDGQGNLLVNSVADAQACLASMQRYVAILHRAVALAPYMVADEEYQHKRHGILGQLIHQGRALAAHKTREIVATIRERAAAGKLNRGLSLSLPYFDDQELEIRTVDFDVIPGGRIMFLAAFVVRAARDEQAKVAQDTRMSPSTRKYLLRELELLERAFAGLGRSA